MLKLFVRAAAVLFSFIAFGGMMTTRQSLLRELPPWVHLGKEEKNITLHTAEGDENVQAVLKNGKLSLGFEGGEYISDKEWVTADCFVFDVDHDGYDEVMLHVWKISSFGEHRPFWLEDEPDDSMTEHLFIYEWDINRPDRLKAVWMSSQMPVQGEMIEIADEDVVITAPDSSTTRWRWESWGLALIE